MDWKGLADRAVPALVALLGLVLLVLFFLPWANLYALGTDPQTQAQREIREGDATGMELTKGTVSMAAERLVESPEGQATVNEIARARPWFILGLLLPIGLLLVGVVGLAGGFSARAVGAAALALAAGGVLVVVAGALVEYSNDVVDYAIAREKAQAERAGQQALQMFQADEAVRRAQLAQDYERQYRVRATGLLWLSLALYIAATAAAIAAVVLPASTDEPQPEDTQRDGDQQSEQSAPPTPEAGPPAAQ